MQPSRFYIALIGFFLAALVFAAMFFVTGMNETSYLINDGAGYGLRYIDKPNYDANMQGLIFVFSFLVAGLLLLLLIILPDQEGAFTAAQPEPPQPRRRTAPTAAPAPAPVAPQPVAAPRPVAAPQPAAAEAVAQDQVEPAQQETTARQAPARPAAPAPEAAPAPSVDDELAIAEAESDFVLDDLPESPYEDTGDEDVVYGSGRVTDDSVWDFIHSYPDSAVKFLYRKSLENKPLTPGEEDIYRRWEMRGMTRAKVRQFVLEVMGWKSLPDDFPHNIWRDLRDQIFELKERLAS